MAKNRKAAEAFIIKYIDAILPDSDNSKRYKELFASMSDAEFDRLMSDIGDEKRYLVLYAPNFTNGYQLNIERNLKIAKELGHNFFQRLWIGPTKDLPAYLSPVPYLIVDLPLRRASQMIISKLKVPESNRTVDHLSGQPTGPSKGSKISLPELQVLSSLNLDNTVIELMKFRGGDTKGFRSLNAMISKYGTVNLQSLEHYAGEVESTKTLRTLLIAAHLRNTL